MNSLEIAARVAKSYLPEETKSDPKAIKAAIEPVISDMAYELWQETESGSRL